MNFTDLDKQSLKRVKYYSSNAEQTSIQMKKFQRRGALRETVGPLKFKLKLWQVSDFHSDKSLWAAQTISWRHGTAVVENFVFNLKNKLRKKWNDNKKTGYYFILSPVWICPYTTYFTTFSAGFFFFFFYDAHNIHVSSVKDWFI